MHLQIEMEGKMKPAFNFRCSRASLCWFARNGEWNCGMLAKQLKNPAQNRVWKSKTFWSSWWSWESINCIEWALATLTKAVESEVPSSNSDSWQFRLSDSNSDSGPTPTFSCISYLLKVMILFRWIHKPYLHFPGIRKLILNRCKCTFISHFCEIRSSRS